MKKAKVSAIYDGGSMTEEEARRARMNARARKPGHAHVMTGKPRRMTRRRVKKTNQMEFELEGLLTIPGIIEDNDQDEMIKKMEGEVVSGVVMGKGEAHAECSIGSTEAVVADDHQVVVPEQLWNEWEGHQEEEEEEEAEEAVWWEEYWPEKCCWSYEEGWMCSCSIGGGGGVSSELDGITGNVADEQPWEDDIWNLR